MNHIKHLHPIIFLSVFTICLLSCNKNNNDDDDIKIERESILPFDSFKHIYGTIQTEDDNLWEVVIDPSTGIFDPIPRTDSRYGFDGSPGTTELTSFETNQRIYIEGKEVVLQDLFSFEEERITLRDASSGLVIVAPKFLRFGEENTLYIINTDNSLWKVNLASKVVQKTEANFNLNPGEYISNFFYLEPLGYFILLTNSIAINSPYATKITVLNYQYEEAFESSSIESSFGFVQHPNDPEKLYAIQAPSNDIGFRLVRFEVSGIKVLGFQVSSADLDIDQLSPYLQTIHTSTDNYIVLSSNGLLDKPENTFYSIGLSNGNLKNTAEVEESVLFLKLAGS